MKGHNPGSWEVLEDGFVQINLSKKANSSQKFAFKFKFNEDGSEGVLVEPVRNPPSKMILNASLKCITKEWFLEKQQAIGTMLFDWDLKESSTDEEET